MSQALDQWATDRGVRLDFIRPGRPVENCFIESFNGRFRDECLNVHHFHTMAEARERIERWRLEYKADRPHGSLQKRTPIEFAASLAGQQAKDHRTTTLRSYVDLKWGKRQYISRGKRHPRHAPRIELDEALHSRISDPLWGACSMRSLCLHCCRQLGSNSTLSSLPVGRRLAFDPAKGRLWIVCPHCARWNLVPLDSRLEAIDASERLYRNTGARFSTGNIGIARLRDGVELIRIGRPLLPEYAAWRYGDSLGKRRRRALMFAAGGAAAVGWLGFGFPFTGLGVGLLTSGNAAALVTNLTHRRLAISLQKGQSVAFSPFQLGLASIVRKRDGTWAIKGPTLAPGGILSRLRSPLSNVRTFDGEPAMLLLAGVLAHANLVAGTKRNVADAVSLVEEQGSFERLLPSSASRDSEMRISHLPAAIRLAIEISVNESAERDALAGRLRLLEQQWRQAEYLAELTDSLVFDP